MADNTSPFLDVFCECSGKDYRFTPGTKAEFAVSVINRKLGCPRVIYIEAAKEGEEPISFGNNADLVNYGHGWKLRTVIDDARFPGIQRKGSKGSKSDSKTDVQEGDQSLKYMWRIFIAFVVMFILGALFTIALENLPRFILLFNNTV